MNSISKNILSIFISSALLCTACKNNTPEEVISEAHTDEGNSVGFTEAQLKTAGIELGKITQRQISGAIKANGKLDVPPQQLVSISVPLGGFLKNTELLQGTRVKKGQVIATIENLDFIQLQQDYLEATNQLEFAKTDYERQQELAKENVNAQKTLQQAKTAFTSWQVKRKALEEKLKMININLQSLAEGNITNTINLYAPINGYVTQVNVNIGKFVNPTDILFEIVDTEHLHAELTVFEKDILKIKIGQKVRFTLANEAKERTATIYLIGREINSDRTIRIHCHIDKEDEQLLPGMYLTALVEAGGNLVMALPDQAIVDFQGKKYIFIPAEDEHSAEEKDSEDKEHFAMIEIQTGNSEMGYTEILLPEGFVENNVVVAGAYAILSKIKNSEEEGHAH
jgi:membrane fusion protein, heavy metal efflux system